MLLGDRTLYLDVINGSEVWGCFCEEARRSIVDQVNSDARSLVSAEVVDGELILRRKPLKVRYVFISGFLGDFDGLPGRRVHLIPPTQNLHGFWVADVKEGEVPLPRHLDKGFPFRFGSVYAEGEVAVT